MYVLYSEVLQMTNRIGFYFLTLLNSFHFYSNPPPPSPTLLTFEESILVGINSTAELIPPKESIFWQHDPRPYLHTDSRFGKKCILTMNFDFFIEDNVIERRNLFEI